MKLLYRVLCTFLIIACAVSSAGANLLEDGGFQSWPTVWLMTGTNVFSGNSFDSYDRDLRVAETPEGGTIWQEIPAWRDGRYTFSICGTNGAFDADTLIQVRLDFLSSEGATLLALSTNACADCWRTYTLSAAAPTGTVIVRPSLFIGISTSTNGIGYWDDAELLYGVTRTTLYVSVTCTNPLPPYGNWDTAATNIQDAVDVAPDGATVIVGDGTYAAGTRTSGEYDVTYHHQYTWPYSWVEYLYDEQLNRIVLDHPVTVRSLNGPHHTILDGSTNARCAFLKSGTSLIGFTLKNGRSYTGYAQFAGGGGAMLRADSRIANCIVVSNRAAAVSYSGGGGVSSDPGSRVEHCYFEGNDAYSVGALYSKGSFVENCIMVRNSGTYGPTVLASTSTFRNCLMAEGTGFYGGGAALNPGCVLENCTIVSNHAVAGGGVLLWGQTNSTVLRNCVIYHNTHNSSYESSEGSNWTSFIGSQSVFFHCCTGPLPPGEGNINTNPLLRADTYQPLYGSPCIDTGMILTDVTNDLLGIARPMGSGYDIGAYEYDSATADSDDDGMMDDQEIRAGCAPDNPSSCLRLLEPEPADANGHQMVLRWLGSVGKRYRLLRSTNLHANFQEIARDIDGTGPGTSFVDNSAPTDSTCFYRVVLQE